MHLKEVIEARAARDGSYAVAYAILQLAEAQREVAFRLKFLGNGDAFTSMGALEAFGLHIGEKLDALTNALRRDA